MPTDLRIETFDGDVVWAVEGVSRDTPPPASPEDRLAVLNRMACVDQALIRHRDTGEEYFLREVETVDEKRHDPIDTSVDGELLETTHLDTETRLNARRVVPALDGIQLAVREFGHERTNDTLYSPCTRCAGSTGLGYLPPHPRYRRSVEKFVRSWSNVVSTSRQ